MRDSLFKLKQWERRLDCYLPRRAPAPTAELLPLLDYVPALTPRWERPEHLTVIAELLERAETETVKALVSTPPQHGKTELLKHGLIRYMQRRPGSRNGFVSYAAQKSEHESRQMQWLADTAGLQPDGSRKLWTTGTESSLVAPGIGGPLTGHPIDGLLIIDDPHKDRREAESSVMRQHVIDWFNSVAIPRLHPGASVIVVQTRWHPNDLYGHLKDQGWEAINLPALNEDGVALWPSQRPADAQWIFEGGSGRQDELD